MSTFRTDEHAGNGIVPSWTRHNGIVPSWTRSDPVATGVAGAVA